MWKLENYCIFLKAKKSNFRPKIAIFTFSHGRWSHDIPCFSAFLKNGLNWMALTLFFKYSFCLFWVKIDKCLFWKNVFKIFSRFKKFSNFWQYFKNWILDDIDKKQNNHVPLRPLSGQLRTIELRFFILSCSPTLVRQVKIIIFVSEKGIEGWKILACSVTLGPGSNCGMTKDWTTFDYKNF